MRWRLMLSVLVGLAPSLCLITGSGIAQPPGDTRGEGAHPPDPTALIPTTRVAKFRLILGRLSLDPPSHIKCERRAELSDQSGHEQVEVTACRGIPSLHYRLESALRAITLDVTNADHLRVKSVVKGEGANEILKIDQPSHGPIRVELTSYHIDGTPLVESFSVSSLVHLRADYGALYQRHIAPLLSRLLESEPAYCDVRDLLTVIEKSDPLDGKLSVSINLLTEKLKSPSRVTRNRAEADIKAYGLPALNVIDNILRNTQDLDFEQVMRLRRVRSALVPLANDNPTQLAYWLSSDIEYWNLVANELSQAEMLAFGHQIECLTGQALTVRLQIADARKQ